VLCSCRYSPPGCLCRNQSYYWGPEPRTLTCHPLFWVYGGTAQAVSDLLFNGERALRHRKRALITAEIVLGLPITIATDTALLPLTVTQEIIRPTWEREPPLVVEGFPSGAVEAEVFIVNGDYLCLLTRAACKARPGMWLSLRRDGLYVGTVKVAEVKEHGGGDAALRHPAGPYYMACVVLRRSAGTAIHEYDRLMIEQVTSAESAPPS